MVRKLMLTKPWEFSDAFALYMLIQWSAGWLFGLRLPRLWLRWWIYLVYAVAFVIYGAVLRNLPGFEWFHLSYMQAGLGL